MRSMAFFEPLDSLDDRLWLEHHSGAAAERAVVHRPVAIAREVTEVDNPDRHDSAGACDAQNTRVEVGLDGVWEESEDGKEHRSAR